MDHFFFFVFGWNSKGTSFKWNETKTGTKTFPCDTLGIQCTFHTKAQHQFCNAINPPGHRMRHMQDIYALHYTRWYAVVMLSCHKLSQKQKTRITPTHSHHQKLQQRINPGAIVDETARGFNTQWSQLNKTGTAQRQLFRTISNSYVHWILPHCSLSQIIVQFQKRVT